MSGDRFELFEDFVGASVSSGQVRTGSGIWTVSGDGTPVATMQSSAADTPGILRLSTSAGVGDTALLALGNSEAFLESQQIQMVEFRIRLISNVNIELYAGYAPFIDVGMTAGAGRWVQITNADNQLHSLSAQGGSDNISLGTKDGNSVWGTVRMFPTQNTAHARTLRYGASGSSATAGADHLSNPITSGTACTFGFALKTVAGGAKSLEIDYVRIVSTPLARAAYG